MIHAHRPRPACPVCGEPVALARDLCTEGGSGWVAEDDGGKRCPIDDPQLQALTEYAGLLAGNDYADDAATDDAATDDTGGDGKGSGERHN